MTESIVETALRATYHLSGSDAARLRRLTQRSGLEAENILSRLAIVQSIVSGSSGPYSAYQPSQAGHIKEIRGPVLLGRPRQAAVILALLARSDRAVSRDFRASLTWHWARGLRILEDTTDDGDILTALARQLSSRVPSAEPPAGKRARRVGLGAGLRDEMAAAVGRRFPRWPTEVRRLVAMVARLDPSRLDTVVERFASYAESAVPGGILKEGLALRIMRERWGVNRIGLNANDRIILRQLLQGEVVSAEEPAIPFLTSLGLVTLEGSIVHLSSSGRQFGEEAVQP